MSTNVNTFHPQSAFIFYNLLIIGIFFVDKGVRETYNDSVMQKPLSKFKLRKLDRDTKIKAYYQNLPTGMRSMRAIARIFGVSRSTVLYAVNGRAKK